MFCFDFICLPYILQGKNYHVQVFAGAPRPRMTKKRIARTKTALCTALICISAYISFPLPMTPVPVTAQTIAINITAILLTPAQSAAALGVYLLLGFCGIPVFSGGTAGFAQLFSPTGGFLIGFFVSAVLVSLLKGKKNNFIRHCLICIFVGIPTVDFFGALFMCLIHNYSPLAALSGAIVPFLFGDLLKAVGGALIGTSVNRLLAMRR